MSSVPHPVTKILYCTDNEALTELGYVEGESHWTGNPTEPCPEARELIQAEWNAVCAIPGVELVPGFTLQWRGCFAEGLGQFAWGTISPAMQSSIESAIQRVWRNLDWENRLPAIVEKYETEPVYDDGDDDDDMCA